MFKNKTQCNKTRKDEVIKIAKALNLNFDKKMKKEDLCKLILKHLKKSSPSKPSAGGKKPSPGKKNKCTSDKIEKCKKQDKLCNPESGRCVGKNSKKGKELLAQQGRKPSPQKPSPQKPSPQKPSPQKPSPQKPSPNERAMLLARLEKLNRVLLNIKSEKDELLDKYLASGRKCDENVNNCNKDEVCDYQMRRCMKLSKNEEKVLGNGVEIREIGGKKIIGTREVLNNLARLFATSAGGYADAAGSPGVGGADAAGSPGVGGEGDEDVEAIIRQLEAGRTDNLSKVNQQILRCLGLM